MEIEVLKNLPSLPKRLSKTSQSQPPGLDTSVHKFYEKREFIIRGYMIAWLLHSIMCSKKNESNLTGQK